MARQPLDFLLAPSIGSSQPNPMKFPSLTLTALLASSALSGAATLSFDWTGAGDQGLLGWTNEKIDTTSLTAIYAFNDNGDQLGAYRGDYGGSLAAQDISHKTLVAQSPFFMLTASSSISFSLSEGMATTPLVTDYASLPANSSAPGFVGLAFMRVSDGAYLLSQSKAANNSTEAFSFDNATILAATIGDAADTQYALQLIDYKESNWGHVGLKTATLTDVTAVPEPSAVLLAAPAFLLMLRLRRRSNSAA